MPRIYYACTGLLPTEWTVIIRHSDCGDWRGCDDKLRFRGVDERTVLAVIAEAMGRIGNDPSACDYISSVIHFQMVDAATGLEVRNGHEVFRDSFARVLGVKGF